MLFGPVTDVERLTWQRQAALVLADLLRDAARRELPFVLWQLGHGRTLTAQCMETDMEARRAAFVAWAEFLGMSDWQARDDSGVTRFYGLNTDFQSCRLVLTANVYRDSDETASGGGVSPCRG